MSRVKIEITGPGGVINYEYLTVLNALRTAGINVIESNDHQEIAPEEFLDMIRQRIDDGIVKKEVSLYANHLPWGG
jgi:hypothetical protein